MSNQMRANALRAEALVTAGAVLPSHPYFYNSALNKAYVSEHGENIVFFATIAVVVSCCCLCENVKN